MRRVVLGYMHITDVLLGVVEQATAIWPLAAGVIAFQCYFE